MFTTTLHSATTIDILSTVVKSCFSLEEDVELEMWSSLSARRAIVRAAETVFGAVAECRVVARKAPELGSLLVCPSEFKCSSVVSPSQTNVVRDL